MVNEARALEPNTRGYLETWEHWEVSYALCLSVPHLKNWMFQGEIATLKRTQNL